MNEARGKSRMPHSSKASKRYKALELLGGTTAPLLGQTATTLGGVFVHSKQLQTFLELPPKTGAHPGPTQPPAQINNQGGQSRDVGFHNSSGHRGPNRNGPGAHGERDGERKVVEAGSEE